MMAVEQSFQEQVLAKIGEAQSSGGDKLNLTDIQHPNAEATEWVATQIQSQLPRLTELSLWNNNIDDVGVRALAEVFSQGGLSQLAVLYLAHNRIGDSGMVALAEAVSEGGLPQLSTLDLGANSIGDAGAKVLVEATTHGGLPRLTYLSLWGNQIGEAGAKSLAEATEHGGLLWLTSLNLGNNLIREAGVRALSDAVSKGGLPQLATLLLGSNQIGDAGAVTLAEAGRQGGMPLLMSLDLWGNQIGEAGAMALAEAIRTGHWSKLTELNLDNNGLSVEQALLELKDPQQLANAILGLPFVPAPPQAESVAKETSSSESQTAQPPESVSKAVANPNLQFRRGAPASMGDEPASVDLLGRDPWITALAAMFASPEQSTPFTLALFGDWGGGKSSLLRLLTKRLREQTRHADSIEFDFATFNAWEYEKTDNIAAGLAQEVVKGLVEGAAPGLDKAASIWGRFWHWFSHRWKRCRLALNFAAREHGWRFWRFPIGMLLLSGLLIAGWEFPLIPQTLESLIPQWMKGAQGGIAAAIPAFFGWTVMIGCFAWGWKNLSELLEHPLSVEMHTFLQLPGYKQHLGTVPVLKQQIRTLCEMRLGKQGDRTRRLIVYVDDLDRCSPECIVSTLEAVRLVMDLEHVIVLIAVDPRIALKAVGHHYRELADKHRTSEEIAREYLAKIIQLPVQLPPVNKEQLTTFVREKLFGAVMDSIVFSRGFSDALESMVVTIPGIQLEPATGGSEVRYALSLADPGPIASRNSIVRTVAPPPIVSSNLKELQRQLVLRDSISDRDEFIEQVQKSGFQNPRQLIRLRNGFRLLKVVAHESQLDVEHGDLLARLFRLESERLNLGKPGATASASPLAENSILDEMVKAVVLPQFLQPQANAEPDATSQTTPTS